MTRTAEVTAEPELRHGAPEHRALVFALFESFFKDTRYGFASALSVVLFVVLLIMSVIQFKLLDRKVHYQ